MNALVLFYSSYGHIYEMAKAVAEGIQDVSRCTAAIKRVPEILPNEVLEAMGSLEAQKKMAHVPICTMKELPDYDAIIFGTPTRYGNMIGHMRIFLDSTGPLWASGALVGKVGSGFTSSATQHGGQETTLLSLYNTLFHHGMVITGLPYTFAGQMRMDEITGCSPYGASTIAGAQGERWPTDNELAGARFQGNYVAKLAARLIGEYD